MQRTTAIHAHPEKKEKAPRGGGLELDPDTIRKLEDVVPRVQESLKGKMRELLTLQRACATLGLEIDGKLVVPS